MPSRSSDPRSLRHHAGGDLLRELEYDDIATSHNAELNVVMCHRSINYMAEMMESKFGIPWFKVNFIGADSTAKILRKIAEYFGDEDLTARVEEVIADELAKVVRVRADVACGSPARPPCCSWGAPGPTTTRTCSARWA